MALEIREDKGVFEILGNVSSQNLGALQVYFDSIVEKDHGIVVNLEKVNTLDAASALFFEKLYADGASKNKMISIVGRQNVNIQEVMNETHTKYILSTDGI